MPTGPDANLKAEPAPPQKKPSQPSKWRFIRRLLSLGVLLGVVAVGLLFVPGWPLAPLAPVANHFLQSNGLQIELHDLWLQAHTTGHLTLKGKRLAADDSSEAEAIVVENLSLTWPFDRLLHGDPLSLVMEIDRIQVAPRLGPEGQWIVIQPTASEEDAEEPEETAGPVTPPILHRFWTDPANPLRIKCKELQVVFPEDSPFAARQLTMAPTLTLQGSAGGPLTLSGDLGPVLLDRALLASGSLEGTIDLGTASAQLECLGRLENSGLLRAFLPADQPMPAAIDVETKLKLELGWDPLKVDRCEFVVLSHGGDLQIDERSLPFPAWEFRGTVEAHDFAPLPDATVHLEADLWYDGRENDPTRSQLDLTYAGATSLVSVEATTSGWTLGMMRHWVKGLEDLQASGRFGATGSGVYDLSAGTVQKAQVALTIEQGQAELPEVLLQPAAIAPTRISVVIGKHIETGQVEPFTLKAGPVELICKGLQWSLAESSVGGEGSFTVVLPTGAVIPEWIRPEALAHAPISMDELAEIALSPVHLEMKVTGSDPTQASIDLSATTRVVLNDGHLDLSAQTTVNTSEGNWEVTLDLPTFDPGTWNIALFERLPVPQLDLPMSLHLTGNGTLDGQLVAATWEYRAGPGVIHPNGPLAQWLQAAVPVDEFLLGGRLRENAHIAELDTCEFRSGRARMHFTRMQLDMPQSVLTGTPTSAHLQLGLLFENWHPADFMPLLVESLRDQVPLSAEEIAELGLARLELKAETDFALDENQRWVPRSLKASVDTDFVGGRADIPITTQIDFDPTTGVITATATSASISPEIWQLKPLAELPIDLCGIAVPIQFEVRLSTGFPGTTDIVPPKIGFTLSAGPGSISLPAYLQRSVELEKLNLDLQIRLDTLALDEASMRIDLDGPTITIGSFQAMPNDSLSTWQTRAELVVEQLTLEWFQERVAPEQWKPLLPPAFLPSKLAGEVTIRASVATLIDPSAAELPAFDQLAYALQIDRLEIDWENRPPLGIAQLKIDGGADQSTVDIRDLSVGGWDSAAIHAQVQNPLAKIPEVQIELDFAGNLQDLAKLYDAWAGPLELGENPLPTELTGRVGLNLSAKTTLTSEVDLNAIAATMQVKIEGVALPPLLPGPTKGEGALSASISLASGAGRITGQTRFHGLEWMPFLSGDAVVDFQAEGALDQSTAKGGFEANLRNLRLSAPDGLWDKPRGAAAKLAGNGYLPGGWPSEGPRTANWDFSAEGFVFNQMNGRGSVTLNPVEGAAFGGLQNATLTDFQFDAGRLNAAITATRDRIDLNVALQTFDIPLLMQRTAAIFRAMQPAPEAAAAETASTEPASLASPPPVLSDPLPPVFITLSGPNLHLGEGRSLNALKLEAQLLNQLPRSASLRFEIAGEPTSFTLGLPNADHQQTWEFEVANVGKLFDHLTAPSREAPAFFSPDSALLGLNEYVDTILGGHLQSSGWVNLKATEPIADGTLKLEGIAFLQEVPLLSKLAALAKKKLVMRVPCHVFEWKRFHFENQLLTARDGFIDGPINLSFENVLADLKNETVNAKGKVFGLCFELDGPLASPKPYLCEDGKVIQALTTEDEFVW